MEFFNWWGERDPDSKFLIDNGSKVPVRKFLIDEGGLHAPRSQSQNEVKPDILEMSQNRWNKRYNEMK